MNEQQAITPIDEVHCCITDVRDFLACINEKDCTFELYENLKACAETLQQAIDLPFFDEKAVA